MACRLLLASMSMPLSWVFSFCRRGAARAGPRASRADRRRRSGCQRTWAVALDGGEQEAGGNGGGFDGLREPVLHRGHPREALAVPAPAGNGPEQPRRHGGPEPAAGSHAGEFHGVSGQWSMK